MVIATAVVLAGRFAASMGTATLSMFAAARQAGATTVAVADCAAAWPYWAVPLVLRS